MLQDTVLVAPGNDLDAPKCRIAWCQRQPRRHKRMRFNAHVGRVLVPADKARTLRFFEKKHTAPQKNIRADKVRHGIDDYRMMGDLVDTFEREVWIVAVGGAQRLRVRGFGGFDTKFERLRLVLGHDVYRRTIAELVKALDLVTRQHPRHHCALGQALMCGF